MRLLDIRSFELKSSVHAVFDRIWKELIQVDMATGQVAIYSSLKGMLVPTVKLTATDITKKIR